MRLALIAYGKWNFRVMDVSWAFLRSGHWKRDTYGKLPEESEKDNVARKLLKPLFVLSTACKDWYKNIRDFLAIVCVCVGGGGRVKLLP